MFDKLYGKKSIKKDSPLVKYIEMMLPEKVYETETPTHVDEIDVDAFMKYRVIDDFTPEKYGCIKYKYETDDEGVRLKIPNGISYTKLFKKFDVTEEEKQRFSTKTVYGKYDGIHTRRILKYLLDNSKYPSCKLSDKIRYEQELLGYINYENSNLDKRLVVVTKLDDKWSPKFTAYCINNGKRSELKIHKKRNPKNKQIKTSWADLPLHDGDIIYMKDCKKEPKRRKTDNGWQDIPGEYEWWLNDYSIYNL